MGDGWKRAIKAARATREPKVTPPDAQERADKVVRKHHRCLTSDGTLCDACRALKASVADAIAQAVQAAYEHAAEIAQDHQCPHRWHSCGGDIAAALRARPAEPTGEKG